MPVVSGDASESSSLARSRVSQGIDTQWLCPDNLCIDTNAEFDGPELLEALSLFEHTARKTHEASQRRAAISVHTDVVVIFARSRRYD